MYFTFQIETISTTRGGVTDVQKDPLSLGTRAQGARVGEVLDRPSQVPQSSKHCIRSGTYWSEPPDGVPALQATGGLWKSTVVFQIPTHERWLDPRGDQTPSNFLRFFSQPCRKRGLFP
jgi:hypothetical protein